jgi:hypothetical protein
MVRVWLSVNLKRAWRRLWGDRMTNDQHDDTTVWRDLADQLTDDQFDLIERMETISAPWTGNVLAMILMRAAREKNAENLADVGPPECTRPRMLSAVPDLK